MFSVLLKGKYLVCLKPSVLSLTFSCATGTTNFRFSLSCMSVVLGFKIGLPMSSVTRQFSIRLKLKFTLSEIKDSKTTSFTY